MKKNMTYRLPIPSLHDTALWIKCFVWFSPLGKFLVLTLFAKSHAKAFTFGGAMDFQMKFARIKGIEMVEAEITLKKELTENDPCAFLLSHYISFIYCKIQFKIYTGDMHYFQ